MNEDLKLKLENDLGVIASLKIYDNVEALYNVFKIISEYEFDLHELVESLNQVNAEHVELFLMLESDIKVLKKKYDMLEDPAKPALEYVLCKVLLFAYPVFSSLGGSTFRDFHWDTEKWV